MQILRTKDTSIFKRHDKNRPIDEPNLRKIMASMKACNLLEFRPILVDQDMHVIDGQHRLEAAKQLGLEVFYQVDTSANSENIILLNANVKPWKIDDYVNFYIQSGNVDYIEFKKFADKNGITLFDLYCFTGAKSGKGSNKLRIGKCPKLTPEIKTLVEMTLAAYREIIRVMEQYHLHATKFTKSPKLRAAIFSILRREGFYLPKLLDKLVKKIDTLHPCSDTNGYFSMVRDIYNWRNPDPIE
jgi:ParB/Sulfiredoxin domain